MTQRLKVLLGVLAAAILFTVWGGFDSDPPRAATAAGARREGGAGRGRPARETAQAEAVVALRVEDLEPRAGELRLGRNPFAFHVPPPPPPPIPVGPSPDELAAMRAAEAAQRAAQEAAAAEPPRPVPPPVDFAYLGSFGPPERRVAVFRDGTGALINALVGDVLSGKFRLVGIGYESVDVEFVGFPEVPPEQVAIGQEGV